MGKVVTHTYEYDKEGRLIKHVETVTETHPTVQPVWVYPQPRPPYYPYVTWTGVSGSGGGSGIAGGSVTYTFNNGKPDDPDAGVTAKV